MSSPTQSGTFTLVSLLFSIEVYGVREVIRSLELPPRVDGEIVVDVDEDAFEGVARALIRGAYKLDGRLLLVLDAERAVALRAAA